MPRRPTPVRSRTTPPEEGNPENRLLPDPLHWRGARSAGWVHVATQPRSLPVCTVGGFVTPWKKSIRLKDCRTYPWDSKHHALPASALLRIHPLQLERACLATRTRFACQLPESDHVSGETLPPRTYAFLPGQVPLEFAAAVQAKHVAHLAGALGQESVTRLARQAAACGLLDECFQLLIPAGQGEKQRLARVGQEVGVALVRSLEEVPTMRANESFRFSHGLFPSSIAQRPTTAVRLLPRSRPCQCGATTLEGMSMVTPWNARGTVED